VACNFDCLVEIGGLLKVTGSHIHCKCGNNSKRCKIRHTVTSDYGLSSSGTSNDVDSLSRSFLYCKPIQVQFFIHLCSC